MPHPDAELDEAVAALARGEIVGLPTETVYGLAADGTNPEAVRKIFALKGRPADHPLILHLGDASWLERYTSDAPEVAHRMAQSFWPGPLSLVLFRSSLVPDEVTGGRDTVAVRVPSHPVAQEVLRRLDRPLAAPSANRFGEVSPTTRAHVLHDFGDRLPVVVEGGACQVGLESTIVDLTREVPRILRPGGITERQLSTLLGFDIGRDDGGGPAAPGTLEAHYAPRAEFRVVEANEVESAVLTSLAQGRRVGVFAPALAASAARRVRFIPMGPVAQAAHDFYDALRTLDDAGCDLIFAARVEEAGIGSALADRMRRAAVGSGRP